MSDAPAIYAHPIPQADLSKVDAAQLRELLEHAWRRLAPARLHAQIGGTCDEEHAS